MINAAALNSWSAGVDGFGIANKMWAPNGWPLSFLPALAALSMVGVVVGAADTKWCLRGEKFPGEVPKVSVDHFSSVPQRGTPLDLSP